MAVDPDITPEFIVTLLGAVSVRQALVEALIPAFDDYESEFHIRALRVDALSLSGDPIAGPTLPPLPEWDGMVETLPEVINQILRHVNRSRTG